MLPSPVGLSQVWDPLKLESELPEVAKAFLSPDATEQCFLKGTSVVEKKSRTLSSMNVFDFTEYVWLCLS